MVLKIAATLFSFFTLLAGISLNFFNFVWAESIPPVMINEIMYDLDGADNGREWVEIHNPSQTDTADLTDWRFEEGGTQHTLNPFQGGMIIPPEGYVVIADNPELFLQDNPGFSGVVIDSAFSLNNSGETLILRSGKDADPPVDKVSYLGSWGGAGNGKSIGLINGIWKETEPNPGVENVPAQSETPPSQQSKPQQKIFFSAPPSVVAGREFSVSVNLSNFEPGTYALKVLVSRDGVFIYGNTKGSSGWLTQNGKWSDMPQLSVGSSGSASSNVQAKVDEDAQSGSYAIAVSVAQKKENSTYEALWAMGDLETKGIIVSASAIVSSEETEENNGEAGLVTEELGSQEEDHPAGEVLGQAADKSEPVKLNFYIILGVFGLAVGILGLVAYRRLANGALHNPAV